MHVACFYMSQIGIAVERSRLTHLWGEPVGLAGPDGTLAAASDETMPFGVKAGQDTVGARALCPHLIVLPYDRAAYEEAARCVWDLFAIESSFVEPVSPEVCYLELSPPDAVERAQQLALDIAARIRIPVRVGLAGSKFVARKAAEGLPTGAGGDGRNSPGQAGSLLRESSGSRSSAVLDELFRHVPVGKEGRFLGRVPIDGIPGLDTKTRQKLQRLGVRTFGDVLKLPKKELLRQLREPGYRLYRLARGQDFERVKPSWPPRSVEESLELDDETSDEATVREAIRLCAESLSRKLAVGREYCRSLALRMTLADGSRVEEIEKLAMPADSPGAIHAAALRILKRMLLDQPVLGVALRGGDLGAGSGIQLALLDENRNGAGLPHERYQSLEAALAFLRKRFGPGAVVTAGMMRRARRIGLWTYPLGHLMNEPVQVATDECGRPLRYWRRGCSRDIKRIHNRWRESEWAWGGLSEKTVYRVETDPSGICELHSLGSAWRLCGLAD